MSSVAQYLTSYKARSDAALQRYLPSLANTTTPLQAAMHYSVTNGGKRVRPVLTYATGKALGIALERLDVAASAIELMHAYSLVHDDLPAMDDDDLRRGKPTCHRQFDEATAILAGDALQALAFTILAENPDPRIAPQAKLDMIILLGSASGANGMAAGQAIDLASVGETLNIDQLQEMHSHKTGALIRASIMIATLTATDPDTTISKRLEGFAEEIGLAFQIVDDILDVVSDTETLGKPQGADDALNKPTYPALLGLEGARKHAEQTHQRAMQHLSGLGNEFDELRQISSFVIERSH